MASVRDLAHLSFAVYKFEPYNKWKIERKYDIAGDIFQAAWYTNGVEDVIAYRGSDEAGDWVIDDAAIASGQIPPQAVKAILFFESIVYVTSGDYRKEDIFNRKGDTFSFNFSVTGHSLGGVLATIVGNKYALNTATFNSPGTAGMTTRMLKYDKNGEPVIDVNEVDSGKAPGYQLELRPSPDARDKIYNYIIDSDLIGNRRDHYGHTFYAKVYGTAWPDEAHWKDQWVIDDRFESDGSFDPDKPINKVEVEYQRPERLAGS